MESKQNNTPGNAGPTPTPSRALVVAGRWILVIAGVVVILLGLGADDAGVRFGAFAILCFLLANALWQHTSLLRACVVAFAVTSLFGIAVTIYRAFADAGDAGSALLCIAAAALGAVLSYPVLTFVDRLASGRR